MSRVGRVPVRYNPSTVTLALRPYDKKEIKPIKPPSRARLQYCLRKKPLPETFSAFGTPHMLTVDGPLGSNRVPIHSILDVTIDDAESLVSVKTKCDGKTKLGKTMWGTVRTDIQNAITGVSTGFRKDLELHGVGFRARLEPAGTIIERKPLERESLVLRLGFCYELVVPIHDDITIMVPSQTQVVVLGHLKYKVGEIAATIKHLRKPDAYKDKGVRYAGEVVRFKPGKRK